MIAWLKVSTCLGLQCCWVDTLLFNFNVSILRFTPDVVLFRNYEIGGLYQIRVPLASHSVTFEGMY